MIEVMKQALEALEYDTRPETEYGINSAITILRQAIAEAEKQEQDEPVAFEEWLSKQHGDPEEIGFLQALRIAYISGQDSITTPQPRKPLTDKRVSEIVTASTGWSVPQSSHYCLARAIEAAHGIKE